MITYTSTAKSKAHTHVWFAHPGVCAPCLAYIHKACDHNCLNYLKFIWSEKNVTMKRKLTFMWQWSQSFERTRGWLALKTAVKSDGREKALEIQENSNHCASGLRFFTFKGWKCTHWRRFMPERQHEVLIRRPILKWASLVAQTVKNPPAMWKTWVWPPGWEDPLEEGIATHASILAWSIPKDRGAWWATVHGVTKSRTWLSSWAHTAYLPFIFLKLHHKLTSFLFD